MKDYKRIEHMRNLNDSLIWERMKRCYDFGYEDGKADTPFTDTEEAEKTAYERGLNDAWDAARKIAQTYAHFTCYDLNKIFGDRDSVGRKMIFEEYTPQDAIRKIKEYENKQKQDAEIKVGDEVVRHIAVLNRMLESMDVYDSIQPTTERKKAIKAAIKALDQQPCEDVISREAVLDAIEREDKWLLAAKGHNGLTEVAFSGLKARVDALPSVTQKSAESEEV